MNRQVQNILGRKLKIMQIAPFAFSIGTTARYGGIERVVNNLDKGFLAQGHDSYIIATGDSKIEGTLLPVFDHGLWISEEDKRGGWKYKKENFNYDEVREEHAQRAIEYIKKVNPDIIQDHIGFIKTEAFNRSANLPPILYTLHDPVDDPRSKERLNEIKETHKEVFFNAISFSQKGFFDEFTVVDYMVYNGVDMDFYPYSNKGEGFVFHLGLLNKPKGTDLVVKIARDLNKKTIIAGPILTGRIHEPNRIGIAGNFWNKEVKPYLDLIVEKEIPSSQIGDFVKSFMRSKYQIAYVGELNDSQKVEFYKRAESFYFPIRRKEPFGLVLIESMACGTPVVAYDNGAVREIISHGKTGYVVDPKEIEEGDMPEFKKYTSIVTTLSREDCRNHIEENFSVKRQVGGYLGVYRDMLHDVREGLK